jgi:predicted transcriptional regulator
MLVRTDEAGRSGRYAVRSGEETVVVRVSAGETQPARRAAGQLEAEILAVLWAAPTPLSPAQVQAALGELAYNTVHTILTRLTEKGQVARVTHDSRPAYAPVKDAAQHAADRMLAALDAGPGRKEVLATFVTRLTADEEAALRAVLRRGRRG